MLNEFDVTLSYMIEVILILPEIETVFIKAYCPFMHHTSEK
jgi:hypothetical protein